MLPTQPEASTDASIRQNDAGEALYRAVRVAVLSPDSQVGTGGSVTASNLLPVHDGWTGMTTTAYGNISTTPFTGSSVNDWYGGAKTNNVAVKANGTLSGYRFDEAIYGSATEYDGSAAVVTLAAASGTGYGDAVQAVIRVWLEGEDKSCNSATYAQLTNAWSLDLDFQLTSKTEDGDGKTAVTQITKNTWTPANSNTQPAVTSPVEVVPSA